MKKWLKWIGIALIVFLIVAQFVPVSRTNPAITREVKWDTPATRALAQRACFDCHSNETQWPWYAYLAPFSWRVTGHVQEARSKFNLSEWSPGDGDEAARLVAEDKMPLWDYRLLHPAAQLSEAEKQAFIAGLKATLGQATLPAQVSSVR